MGIAKIFLKSIRNETLELKELQERHAWLWGEILPKGMRPKEIQVMTSIEPDKLGDNRAAAVDLEKEIEEMMHQLVMKHLRAEKYINQLEDSRQRLVLELYYLSIDRRTWSDVAKTMGYSESVIYDIHGDALVEMDKIMEIDNERK
ncbi:MAG: DUF1492 domain-containing protein [Lachnospiraceae bacterium]|nr:DUF1492 domain-containing protein [Lachnospiraceae bacterium]